MNGRKIWSFKPIIILTSAVLFALSALSLSYNAGLAVCEFAAAAAITAVWVIKLKTLNGTMKNIIGRAVEGISPSDRYSLESFPLPTALVSKSGEIIWYNERFRSGVLNGKDCYGRQIRNIVRGFRGGRIQTLSGDELISGIPVTTEEKSYTVFGGMGKNGVCQLYFVEDTGLRKKVSEYKESRPAVAIIMVDNYEELMQNAKEGERAEVVGMIEKQLLEWVSGTTGFLTHTDRDRYIFVFEERHYRKIVEKRFDILDRVRNIVIAEYIPATLSIGVGHGGSTLAEDEEMARQALDMALGRGGDQAAVKDPGGYEFYGGTSKGVEKQTKVKTRIMASALSELIDGSDNVLIMGHTGADLDTIGAAAGIYRAALMRGRDARIVINRRQSMARNLIDYLEKNGYDEAFVEPDDSLFLMTPKTLLVIVDTHRKGYLESPELYKSAKSVAVIDHHRKMVDYIDNAVIFYTEPYASSASEMVTELIQYIADKAVSPTEAGALLAGMSLDTRNFTVRTGVRTFEAAAYLKKKGADIAAVKRLFSGSLEDYRRRTKLVSSAKIYRKCAIAVCGDDYGDSMKFIAPQAADDLLTISGVAASFVISRNGDDVNISARSLGDVNVQLIMEKLGGGGHLTMAGSQLEGVSLTEAERKVKAAMDSYFDENKKTGADSR